MTNLLILGAGGNIATKVIDLLAEEPGVRLHLFLRNAGKLGKHIRADNRVIVGDARILDDLLHALKGIDIVYANLAGDLERMAENIVAAMQEKNVKRLIFISSIGIYDEPIRPVLRPYRRAADVIEASGVDYTILRPTWFTDADEVDYELTRKGEPERGSVISQKSLASFIAKVIKAPETYKRENLGINKPNS